MSQKIIAHVQTAGPVQINAFEVASDAFTTFERLLTKHEIVADFLNSHFQRFFTQYEQLLQSEANYATQRQVCMLSPMPEHLRFQPLTHCFPCCVMQVDRRGWGEQVTEARILL